MRIVSAQTKTTAGWAGRLLLSGAVVLWWGGVVGTGLLSLAFPAWRGLQDAWLHIDPDAEGTLANWISAAALFSVAATACATAVVQRRRGSGWIIVGGWSVLALTAVGLGIEELASFKVVPASAAKEFFGRALMWPVFMSPLAAAFLLAMAVFLRSDRQSREVRAVLALGMVAWSLVLLYEVATETLFVGVMAGLGTLLEETLEFGGTLLVGLGAGIVLRGTDCRLLRRRIVVPLAIGSLAVSALVGVGLSLGPEVRTTLVDTRIDHGEGGGFFVALHDEMSLVQELRMPEAPIGQLDIRLDSRDTPNGMSRVTWRIIDGGFTGEFLREGVLEAARFDHLAWHSITLDPPLRAAEGRRLGLQLVADAADGGHLRVGATKTSGYADARLWVNGERTGADQSLEFVAYGAPEPISSKAQSVLGLLASDWHWRAAVASMAVGLALTILIPGVVVVGVALSAIARRG